MKRRGEEQELRTRLTPETETALTSARGRAKSGAKNELWRRAERVR